MENMLVVDDGKIIYNGIHMEAFIPDEYFDTGLIEEVDTGYLLFGNFITYHHDSVDNYIRSNGDVASFELPFMFNSMPDGMTIETVDIGYGLQRYHILHYYNGGVVITRKEMIQSVDNMEKFMSLLMEGKLDNVDYDRLPALLNICKKYNGVKLGVPAMYEEVIVAQTYKNPKDISQSARFTATEKGFRTKGMTLREKAAFTSTFSAITFEDKISMLTISDNAKREGRQDIVSDIEKVSLGIN